MKQTYAIILTPADPETGYLVYVPDLQINTEGETLSEAIEMARDAIGIWGICEEDAGRTVPEPSTLQPEHKADELISLVDIDFKEYRKANDLKTVRKNVTLPSWLSYMAEQNGVNFSQVLQDGLRKKLHVEDRY